MEEVGDLKDRVMALPRWAQVAFTARCARRVHPVFLEWAEGSPAQKTAVARAIEAAEVAGGSALCTGASVRCVAVPRSAGKAYAVAQAAYAAYRAAGEDVGAEEAVKEAIGATVRVAVMVGPEAAKSVEAGMLRDLEQLRGAGAVERWTNETPVAREFFGPLWVGGLPPGWPRRHLLGEVRVPTTFLGRRPRGPESRGR